MGIVLLRCGCKAVGSTGLIRKGTGSKPMSREMPQPGSVEPPKRPCCYCHPTENSACVWPERRTCVRVGVPLSAAPCATREWGPFQACTRSSEPKPQPCPTFYHLPSVPSVPTALGSRGSRSPSSCRIISLHCLVTLFLHPFPVPHTLPDSRHP